MRLFRRVDFLAAALTALVAAATAGCGPDICLNCEASNPTPGPGNTVTLKGNIQSMGAVPNPVSDVIVVSCVNLATSESLINCPTFYNTQVDNDGTFLRSLIPAGSLRVGFWIPSDSSSGAGSAIGETDLFAELDSNGELNNLQDGETANVANVQITFGTGISPGTATADITVDAAPTPTPSPAGTPTPGPATATPAIL